MTARVHALILTALPAEARPLIDCWRMQRDTHSRAFPVYHTHNGSDKVSLIVSGIGKINAAAGCAHLVNLCAPETAVWLNAGIAGHAKYNRGETFIAHSIEDANSGKKWYPPILFDPGCPSEHLISIDRVASSYPVDAAVDMEASAFFATATRYTTAELVQSVKVVSDNSLHGVEQINPQSATRWMEGAVDLIVQILTQLRQLAAHLPPDTVDLPPALQKFRFTVTQRYQCLEMLRRWQALNANIPVPEAAFESIANAREAIAELREQIAAQTVTYAK